MMLEYTNTNNISYPKNAILGTHPIHIFLWSERIHPPTTKPQYHGFDCYIPRQENQICPRNGLPVLFLDGPENVLAAESCIWMLMK